VLTKEAKGYLSTGMPESIVFAAVPADGIPLKDLKARPLAVLTAAET
jgi:hypothetical protein